MSSSASYAERQEQRLVGILRHHLYWQDISDIFKGLYSPRIIGHSQYKNLKKTNPATAFALHPWDSNCVSTKCFRHMRDLSPALKTHRWIALASYALPEFYGKCPEHIHLKSHSAQFFPSENSERKRRLGISQICIPKS